MASKKSLYKPAPQDNVESKKARKPLAQGRLTNKSSVDSAMDLSVNTTGHSSVFSSAHEGSVLQSYSGYDPDEISPRQRLSQLSKHSPAAEDPTASPRRGAPRLSEPQSPKPMRPTRSLELSDSDEENIARTRSPYMRTVKQGPVKSPASVLFVDASRQTLHPGATEVDIQTGFEPSHVKVVCHSPGAVQADLRNTGDPQLARRIEIDQVPSVTVLGDTDMTDPTLTKQTTKCKSPHVIRENAVASSIIDPNSAVRTVDTSSHLTRPIEEQLSYQTYKQPKITTHVRDGLDGVQNLIDDTSGLNGRGVEASKPHVPVIKDKESHREDKKKKPKGRIIPSRYMQSMSTTGKPVAALSRVPDKTSKVSSKPSSRSMDLTTTSKSSAVRKRVISDFSTTPMVRGAEKLGGVASTPATASMFHQPGLIDVSAIVPESTPMLAVPTPVSVSLGEKQTSKHPTKTIPRTKQKQKQGLTPTTSKTVAQRSTPGATRGVTPVGRKSAQRIVEKKHPVTPSGQTSVEHEYSSQHLSSASVTQDSAYSSHHKSRKHSSHNVTQQQLDLQYARYLQWLFLDSKARKAHQDQEKDFMAQIYGLWEENRKLKHREAELDKLQEQVQYANNLDELLELQKAGLGPVTANLSKLRQQYSTLALALDTTRHQIPCRGVHIPDKEEEYQEAILAALNESEQLLGELSVMIRQQQPKVASCASALTALERAVEEEGKELKRCQELVSAVQTLTTQESSLQIQQLEGVL